LAMRMWSEFGRRGQTTHSTERAAVSSPQLAAWPEETTAPGLPACALDGARSRLISSYGRSSRSGRGEPEQLCEPKQLSLGVRPLLLPGWFFEPGGEEAETATSA